MGDKYILLYNGISASRIPFGIVSNLEITTRLKVKRIKGVARMIHMHPMGKLFSFILKSKIQKFYGAGQFDICYGKKPKNTNSTLELQVKLLKDEFEFFENIKTQKVITNTHPNTGTPISGKYS